MRTTLVLLTLAFLTAPVGSALTVEAPLTLDTPEILPVLEPAADADSASGPIDAWAPGIDPFFAPAPRSDPTSMGQAIVGFSTPVADAFQVGNTVGGLEILTVEPRIDYIVVRADDLGDVRAAFADVPGVAYIEDDQVLSMTVVPNDSRYGSQYGPAQMGAHAAWDTVGYGSSDIKVAVLDTGIRASHEDLAANFVGGYDYVNNDNNPNDDCGHGTHVSGTVAAVTDNGKGVAGMSQASIIHHKVLGPVGGLFTVTCSGSSSDINAAIMDATDEGARIVSMSLGGGGFSSSGNNAVNYAWNRDVLVVAAAGNDGASNSVDYPGAYDNAIAVAALTSSKSKASYSDMGPEVEIAAAGSNVESTYNSNDQSYDSLSGTSMATPHVAGALALALSCDPGLSNSELRSLMQQTAEDLGSSGRDTSYGYGLLRIDSLVDAIGTCGGGGGPGNQDPDAAFTYSASDLSVSFDGTGSSDADGSITSYAWDFGDGATGSGATPGHTYSADGTYTVTLTVTDNDGATDATSQSITVSAGGPPPSGCDAGFGDPEIQDGESQSVSVPSGGWAYRQICVPADATSISVTIDGPACGLTGCSFDADLHVRDGARASASAYDCRPYESGSDESCTLSVSGEGWFSIGIDAYSGSGTVTLTADHNGAGAPPSNDPPSASFVYSCNDLSCSFDASSSSDPDGDSLSYAWSFGDGATGSGATPGHTYAAGGTYTVTLTVDDGNGGSDQATQSVAVTAPPPPPTGCTDNRDGVAVMDSGADYQASVSSGQWAYGKICAADGDDLSVIMSGPSCGLFGCSFDADLYVNRGSAPTSSDYDCRPYQSGSDESCSLSNLSAGWVYIGVHAYSGSGTVDLTATLS